MKKGEEKKVITEWKGEGKSKQQIKEDIEKLIKKKNKGS
jgi:hypothetical protein